MMQGSQSDGCKSGVRISGGEASPSGTSEAGVPPGSTCSGRNFQLTDLLTAGGAAMGRANSQLTAANAPALLRSYDLTLTFPGSVRICPGATGLHIMRPRPSRCSVPASATASVMIVASYIAAPNLIPVPPT